MIGQTISHYEILGKLGEGGMGIVYKAKDVNLDRFVALKFLPPHLAASEQDKARFIQEAKSASALNHPNVCTIHDIQEHDGQLFIVMEFVDGQTLQEKKTSLSLNQAIEIGIQIAEGLAAAHEKGIVHRDIKPENIMVRKDGIVQIMDFGLAKLKGASRLTKEGSTVGTAGYMSPEQVQGQDADHRSDIFSLGVLLFEMMTKELPFKGVHETAIAYEIVNVDSPPMSSVNQEIPPELDAIILECLEKEPNERAQSAKQVAIDLKRYKRESSRLKASRITAARPAISSSRYQAKTFSDEQPQMIEPAKRHINQWIIIGAVAVVMLGVGYGISSKTSTHAEILPVIRASINMPHGIRYNDDLGGHSELSPDGSMIVFVGSDSLNRSGLWVYLLKSNETKNLTGTERATYPFWSYDSKSIGFFADGKLKTIDAIGGPVLELADAPFGRGAAWSNTGEIIYAPSVSDPNFFLVSSSGGTPRMITAFDSTTDFAPRFPSFFPDGKHYIFTLLELGGKGSHADLYMGSTDNKETKKLFSDCSYGRMANGYLFYLKQGILVSQQFDLGSFSSSGKPVSIQGGVNSWPPRAKADFSVSGNGVLLYAVGGSSKANELLAIHTDGSQTVLGEFEYFTTVDFSPDETMFAYDQIDAKDKLTAIWIYDLKRKVKTRFTFGNSAGSTPCWSQDGKKIFYNVETGGSKANIRVKNSNGSGDDELVAQDTSGVTVGYYPQDVSPDGRYLLVSLRNESGSELAMIDLKEAQRPHTIVKLGIHGSKGNFSSDGKWILYQSNELVSSRIFISTFSQHPATWQLPIDAGNNPLWGKGKIIYFATTRDRQEYCAVSFVNGVPSFGQPQPLFPGKIATAATFFAVTSNGNTIYGMRPANAGVSSILSVIVNWQGLVEKE